ncbi:MAG: PrsW family intramembrane metalloprotease [Bacteroidales bacterium]|jgi:RsiW-degrading membrane proteinase PrsW (M82 family)|nr:PrsW family intramembrane metalloprotease [Bacteroidales bacterium]
MMNILLSVMYPLALSAIFLFYLRFKFKIESWKFLFQAVFFGFVTVIFLLLLDLAAAAYGIDELRSLKRTAFYSFVVVGIGSELGKFLLLRYYFLRQKTFKGPLDSIIYSILIGLSFVVIALPLFMSGWLSHAMGQTFLITYPIASIAFAVVMGFFLGIGKFRQNRFIDSMTGLFAASFFHGFYYFINLTDEFTIFALYGAGLMLLALMFIAKATNLKDSEKRQKI